MPRSRHRENKQIIHHLQKSLCGPERRYEELDHSCWEVRVVQKEGWGTGPQSPENSCGPERRKAELDHSRRKASVVQKEDMRK